MTRLVHTTFVRNEAHCIERMLDSILPYVDESYIMIDDRTTDNTKELIEAKGCKTKLFTFENFGKAKNTLMSWINPHCEWFFGLAPDEIILPAFGSNLKPLLDRIDPIDVDGVRFSRRHWEDLEMTKEYAKQHWYPDWQMRLVRCDYPRIHSRRYVHELTVGTRRVLEVKEDLHHFNMYWKPKIDYNWEEMKTLYRVLDERKKKDGGKDIWPTKEEK